MRTGNTEKGYVTTRNVYKEVKKYDHAQFDSFCSTIYKEGYNDGRKSVPGVDAEQVMAEISRVRGIGEKRMAQIRSAVDLAFATEGKKDE